MNLFGFEISKKIEKTVEEEYDLKSFAPPHENDGTAIVNSSSTSGYYGQVLDLNGAMITNEKDLILKYRNAASQPECDSAVSDIVDASIVNDSDGSPVSLILDNIELPENIKDKIHDEFKIILKLLDFNYNGPDIFRRWYIDGKIYYHLMIDDEKSKDGIREIRQIDPLRIKKVKEITTKIDKVSGVKTSTVSGEYFLYSDDFNGSPGTGGTTTGIRIDPNTVVYVPSGLLDETGSVSISYLHKATKIVNQLRMMEDSLVIYRMARAPERRIFYIDIGNLPKGKAEEYVQGIMAKYRNKLVYDASTGEMRDDRKTMTMLEDFWLPRRDGGRGTEITTLPGGENLGQIDDVVFFQRKLYNSLNVPPNRLESATAYNIGRSTEITRDEVKFQKFVNRLRKKFSLLFIDMLKVQLILKGVITIDDWDDIKENIAVDYLEDNFFSELKDFEIMNERITMFNAIEDKIGKYYSEKWVRSNILNQSDEDIEKMDEQIALEAAAKLEPKEPENDFSGDDSFDMSSDESDMETSDNNYDMPAADEQDNNFEPDSQDSAPDVPAFEPVVEPQDMAPPASPAPNINPGQ
jgi:hypothetical protein